MQGLRGEWDPRGLQGGVPVELGWFMQPTDMVPNLNSLQTWGSEPVEVGLGECGPHPSHVPL